MTHRAILLVFGHICIILGCLCVSWGIYLLPSSHPTLSHILIRPLFWGLFSIMGGVCANFHGFCRCTRNEWGKRNQTPAGAKAKLSFKE
ncbi:MAG: hypothetical protein ACUVTO_04920 [Candidatus Caldatribacteriaceae bacterium]